MTADIDPCPCYLYDEDERGQGTCECGHVMDEHDNDGACTVGLP